MERTTLGRTGLEVSRLGIGLSEIGYNLSFDDEQIAAGVLNAALDAGINFLDTAACYARSEEFIGRTVAGRRDEYILATKAGHHLPRDEGDDWTPGLITESIERSLQRMRTDHLDLVQLHSCAVDVLEKGEVIGALQDAREAGKIRFIGYSGDNENARWAVESGLFDTLQTSFSLVDQGARKNLFPGVVERDMGLIVKRPIGNAVWGRTSDPDPYAHMASSYTEEYFRRAGELAAAGPVENAPDDPITLAMGYTLGHPEVDVAIVGTQRPAHMASNLELVENRLPISSAAISDLERRYDRVAAGWEQRG